MVTKDLPISPRFTPYEYLSRCKFSTLTTRQPMVKFYLLTFPRFPLRKKEHNSCFDKNRTHDFRTTSRCASYLVDHSGTHTCDPLTVVQTVVVVAVFFTLTDRASTLPSNTVYLVRGCQSGTVPYVVCWTGKYQRNIYYNNTKLQRKHENMKPKQNRSKYRCVYFFGSNQSIKQAHLKKSSPWSRGRKTPYKQRKR